MTSRSKWEEMTAYPGELVSAVKQARAGIAEREAKEKGAALLQKTEASLASRKEAPAAKEAPAKKKESVSLGDTMDKVKARNKMLSDL